MTRTYVPQLRSLLDGFTVSAPGPNTPGNGLQAGTSVAFPWIAHGKHFEAGDAWITSTIPVGDSRPADIGGGAEIGTVRHDLLVRWGDRGAIEDMDVFRQAVIDAVAGIVRDHEKEIDGDTGFFAHPVTATSLDEIVQTEPLLVSYGVLVGVEVERSEVYA